MSYVLCHWLLSLLYFIPVSYIKEQGTGNEIIHVFNRALVFYASSLSKRRHDKQT